MESLCLYIASVFSEMCSVWPGMESTQGAVEAEEGEEVAVLEEPLHSDGNAYCYARGSENNKDYV